MKSFGGNLGQLRLLVRQLHRPALLPFSLLSIYNTSLGLSNIGPNGRYGVRFASVQTPLAKVAIVSGEAGFPLEGFAY